MSEILYEALTTLLCTSMQFSVFACFFSVISTGYRVDCIGASMAYEASQFLAVIDSLSQSSITSVLNRLQSHWLLAVMERKGDNNVRFISQNRAYKFLELLSNKSERGWRMSNSSVRGYRTQEHQIWQPSNQAEHHEQPFWSGDWPCHKSNQFWRYEIFLIGNAESVPQAWITHPWAIEFFKIWIRRWILIMGKSFLPVLQSMRWQSVYTEPSASSHWSQSFHSTGDNQGSQPGSIKNP